MGIINSTQIKQLLSQNHTQDYFLTEALCGSAGSQRFDAYAIKKSWANLKYTGYEIKTARGDFLQDDKWRGYLPYCNEFWWVCPKDLIKKEEVAEGCGLIYVYPETGAMRKVVKAKFRNIEPPHEIMLHALMWRETSNPYPFHSSKREYFQSWLEHKRMDNCLGENVSRELSKEIFSYRSIKENNQRLQKDLVTFEKIKQLLRQDGLRFCDEEDLLEKLEKRIKTTTSSMATHQVKDIKISAENILRQTERLLVEMKVNNGK